MPLFHFKAATTSGEVVEGEMEAGNQDAVIKRLQAQGHIPIRADLVTRHERREGGSWSLFRSRRVSQRDVGIFTLELSTMLRAGLPLDKALDMLVGVVESDAVRHMLSHVHTEVRGGASLSAALETQPGTFSGFYVNMVKAGEAGGALEAALSRLAEFMERSRALRESLTSALIYPVILLVVALLSVMLILTFVVPRFAGMFEEAGQSLPLPTLVVMTTGQFVEQYWWVLGLLIAGVYLYLRRELRDPARRGRWHAWVLTLPLVGDLVAKLEVARFTRILGTLLSNGVPLLNAISIAKEIIRNDIIAHGVARVEESVREGQGLAGPLIRENIFPPLATQMLKVGEETGNLEGMLLELADIYEREVKNAIQRLVSLIEPALILGLGLLIAGIIMSLLVAILSVNDLTL